MKRYALWVAVFAFLAALLPVVPAAAQGVTSAAVSALGFAPEQATGVTRALGQRFVRDFSLKRTAVEVAGITVSGNENPLLSPSRTGASATVGGDVINRLPTLGRNFTDFVSTVP